MNQMIGTELVVLFDHFDYQLHIQGEMAGIIPLVLQNDTVSRPSMAPSLADLRRRSCVSPSLSSSSSERQTHHRQYSLPSLQGTTRTSLAPPATLMTIPSNPSEWRNAISEVKRKYLARKYRSCSMQCCEILDNVKDTSVIEPLHLIYLHFYAASSFEWCARPLSSSSAYRTKLLSSAQTHYAEAEALIAAAEWNAAERVRSPSPGLSTSSRTSDESSAPPSPRTSVFSIDDEPSTKRAPRTRVKPKKKVSFSGLPEFFEFQPEPYIRPDSPTLGWDDYALGPQHDVYTSCPISPRTASPTSIIKLPLEERKRQTSITTIAEADPKPLFKPNYRPVALATSEPTENVAPTDQGQNQERSSTPTSHAFDLDSFLQTRTLNRFRTQLSALREQVSRHRTAVDGLLATPENTPVPAMLPSEPNVVPTARPLSPSLGHGRQQSLSLFPKPVPSQTARANNTARPSLRLQTDIKPDVSGPYHHPRGCSSASVSLGQAHDSSTPNTPTSIMSPLSATGGEGNLRDRIERLRASGWRRKRFDNRRYEALREQVLGELAACG